jgi:hypothetical protein
MTKTLLPTAGTYVAIVAAICAVFLVIMQVMPQFGIRFFPGFWMVTASLSPLVLSRPMSHHLARRRTAPLTLHDMLTFTAMVVLPVAAIGLLTEAVVVTGALRQTQDISLSEVLFAPFEERYAIEAVFGLSFFATLVIAALLSCLIFVPARLRVLLHPTQQE